MVKLVGEKTLLFLWISGKNFHDSKAVYAACLAKENRDLVQCFQIVLVWILCRELSKLVMSNRMQGRNNLDK